MSNSENVIKMSEKKFLKGGKAYLCVFVCMATKVLHLEIVFYFRTKAFFNTLKRLIARRGKPRAIFSDNNRNFVGADNLLKKFNRELETKAKVHEFLSLSLF